MSECKHELSRGDCIFCEKHYTLIITELQAENADLLRDFRLAHAELDRIRPAAQEAKDLLWKMQDVTEFSDEIHCVGGRLAATLS
jgi:hypothetical protein